MSFTNMQVCLLELRGKKPQLVQLIKVFPEIFSLLRIVTNSVEQQLEEKNQNHYNEIETLKK